jgi:ABC-type transport system involved in cytochrome bd biosynthesis fused ATPase/permease subunit
MDTVYNLNTHPFSGAPMPKQEHQRLMAWLLVGILVVAIIVGVWCWMSSRTSQTVSTSNRQDIRAEVAALLESAPNHASQAEINKVASLLAKSRSTATDGERAKVAAELTQ